MKTTNGIVSTLVCAMCVAACCGNSFAESCIYKDPKGRTHLTPLPIPEKDANPWTPELEDAFWDRANEAIKNNQDKGYGNLYFENEKRTYPLAMMDFLGGNREKALKVLQSDDTEGYNAYTNMVDFYPCFTLRGQMRKYYFFGEFLDPAYKQKMFDGAKIWTTTDPLTRKHPLQEKSHPGQGFGPDATGVCVDGRNTDNLQAMRETAVYLMAEETGNESVRKIYADKLTRNLRNMFRVGMGEWDSNNYLGHTMTGYIQLYDFAKDEQMRLLGKAAMDYMTCTGAVKYFHGGYGGPCKRDYNHPVVHSGSAADQLGLYFGDYPGADSHSTYDNIHFISSAYRPPLAAVALARKQLPGPTELLISHPPYDALRKGVEKPESYETNYLARTYTFATLSTGTDGPHGDTNGFKLLATNASRGADFFIANTCTNPAHICSAQYSEGDTFGGNNVAQFRNLAIWLNAKADCPYLFFLPKTAVVETTDGITFIALEKAWIALCPVNLKLNGIDAAQTEKANFNVDVDKKTKKETRSPKWPDDQILSAIGTGGTVVGFAMEVGEAPDYADFAAFKKGVLAKSKLDLAGVSDGIVAYTGSLGTSVKIQYNAGQPKVWRNGQEHDWAAHQGLYVPVDGSSVPIRMDWNSGALHVEAGGYVFDGQVSDDGKYKFSNKKLP